MSEIILRPQPTSDRSLIAAFRSGRSENTLRAYQEDLEHFSGHIGASGPSEALAALLGLAPGDANAALFHYRGALLSAGLSPATINRRLSTIRSVVKVGRTLGLTTWQPEIESVRSQAFRDTAGPGLDGTTLLLAAAAGQEPLKAARDRAVIRLLFDLAMRRGEVASLDVEHLELARGRLWVLGKGKRERSPMTMPAETVTAVTDWLAARGRICPPATGPLVVSLAGPTYRQRLTGHGIWELIGALGRRAGIKVRPHGLRHASITAVLDQTGDLRAAQRHGRHANANTTLKYDDNRSDVAGQAARTVANLLK